MTLEYKESTQQHSRYVLGDNEKELHVFLNFWLYKYKFEPYADKDWVRWSDTKQRYYIDFFGKNFDKIDEAIVKEFNLLKKIKEPL